MARIISYHSITSFGSKRIIFGKEFYDIKDLKNEIIENIIQESLFEKDEIKSLKGVFLKTEFNELNSHVSKLKNLNIIERCILNSIIQIQLNSKGINTPITFNSDKNDKSNIIFFNIINLICHKALHQNGNCSIFDNYNKSLLESCALLKINSIDNLKIIDQIIINQKNKTYEFLAIESVIISLNSIMIELLNDYSKVEDKNVFEFIYNDFLKKKEICINELESYFTSSFGNFKKKYQIDFTLSELFIDIFWNIIFHNEKMCNLFIKFYFEAGCDKILKKIVQILFSINIPLNRQIVQLLDIYTIEENDDLMTLIVNEKNIHHIEIQKSEMDTEKEEKNNENIKQINSEPLKDDNKTKNEIKTNNKNISSEEDLEHKTVDEIYDYINDNNILKNKKKKKGRKNKRNKKRDNIVDENCIIDNVVEEFKKDISDKFIHAKSIKKIKPFFSEEWIKFISSL